MFDNIPRQLRNFVSDTDDITRVEKLLRATPLLHATALRSQSISFDTTH